LLSFFLRHDNERQSEPSDAKVQTNWSHRRDVVFAMVIVEKSPFHSFTRVMHPAFGNQFFSEHPDEIFWSL